MRLFDNQKAVASWGRVVLLGGTLALALVAHDASLASSNLLPRRLAFHGAAVVALLACRRVQSTRLGWWWFALLLGAAAGWAASPLRHLGADGLLDALATLGLTWAVASRVESRRRLVRLLVVVAAVGATLGLVEQWLPLSRFLNEATRPAGPFASRATAGAFVAASLPLVPFLFSSIGAGVGAGAYRGRLGAFVVWTVEVAFVISTRARAAWVGGLVALALTRRSEPRARHARHVWLAPLLGVVLALALTPGPQLAWKSLSPYLDSAASLTQAHRDDRLQFWGPSLRLFLTHPLLGVGPGAFEVAFAPFAPAAFTSAQVRVEAPHHEGLRVLLEWGAVGASLLAVAFVLGRPRGPGPRRRRSTRTRALQAALFCLGITSLTGKTFLEPPTLVMAAVLAGLLLRHLRATRRRALPSLPHHRWLAWAAGGALAALALSVDVPRLEDSRRLAAAKTLADRGLTRQAWETAAPAIARSADVKWWLWATRLVCDAGDADRCEELRSASRIRFPGHPLLGTVAVEPE